MTILKTQEDLGFTPDDVKQHILGLAKQALTNVGLLNLEPGKLSQLVDQATLTKVPDNGGIDLNSRNLNLQSSGQKVNIAFDQDMIAQFKRGDFSGVRFQVIDVVPINLMPLLGFIEGS